MRPFIISPSLTCNNRCRFCSVSDLPARTLPADLESMLRDARTRGHDEIQFVGGEPTLCDELPDWIADSKRAGFERIGLQTNGRRLAYKAYVDTLAAAGLSHVDVSLHGHSAVVHDYHTCVPGSFRQTVSGVKRAREAGLAVAVSTVVTRSNMRQLEQLAETIGLLGVRHWRVRVAAGVGRATEDATRVVPRWSMLIPFLQKASARCAVRQCSTVATGLPPCVAPAIARLDDDDAPASFAQACSRCALRQRCTGIDPGYLELYGEEEIRPFEKEPDVAAADRAGAGDTSPFVGGLGRPPANEEP